MRPIHRGFSYSFLLLIVAASVCAGCSTKSLVKQQSDLIHYLCYEHHAAQNVARVHSAEVIGPSSVEAEPMATPFGVRITAQPKNPIVNMAVCFAIREQDHSLSTDELLAVGVVNIPAGQTTAEKMEVLRLSGKPCQDTGGSYYSVENRWEPVIETTNEAASELYVQVLNDAGFMGNIHEAIVESCE